MRERNVEVLPVHVMALVIGFILDLIFGDPYSLPHPIRWMGKFIAALEKPIRSIFPKTDKGEFRAGLLFLIIVSGVFTAGAFLILFICAKINVWLLLVVESIMCYQMLATKSLKTESMKVYDALEHGTLDDARHAVGMIVGRDTENLDAEHVAKAAVETIAENTSDGIVAPLLYMAIGGGFLGVFYKSVNTMDSMIGYKNDKYMHFGTCAAKLDDVLNFVPARISGVLMCIAAKLCKLDSKNAWKIFKRDRLKHASPNSAHTEAACAGALDVQLAGDAVYFGKVVKKQTIGDKMRDVVPEDIVTTNKLMYCTAFLSLILGVIIGIAIFIPTGW